MKRNLLSQIKHWGVYLAIAILSVLSANAQTYILNNGYLRMGNGAENSVNAAGNVQQPFYYEGSF